MAAGLAPTAMGGRSIPIEPTTDERTDEMKNLILASALASMLCGLATSHAQAQAWNNACANGACDLAPTTQPAPQYYDDGSAARLEAQGAEQRLELQLQMDLLAARRVQ
jgi:hypothetical protein